MSDEAKKRYLVTLRSSDQASTDQVVQQLTKKGFTTVEDLSLLNCLLGEFAGNAAELANVPGVVAVEEEQSMSSQ